MVLKFDKFNESVQIDDFQIGDKVICLKNIWGYKGKLNFLKGNEYELLQGIGSNYIFIETEEKNLELFNKSNLHKYFAKLPKSEIKEDDIEWF